MKNKFNRNYRRTTLLSVLSAGFIAGIGLGKSITVPPGLLLVSLILCIAMVPKARTTALLACGLLGMAAGVMRGSQFEKKLQPYADLYGQSVQIRAVAASDAVYAAGGQLEFDAGDVQFLAPTSVKVPGRIGVRGFGAQSISRGDIVVVRGRLSPVLGSKQARLSYANIELISVNTNPVDRARREFAAGMFSAVPEPEASFGLGLLIGQRTTLPKNVNQQLAAAGLTHIIAVSGYNLTIIVRMVRRGLARRSKYQSTVVAAVLIMLFMLVTGFSASIVRAAVVSSLSLLAWYYGRTIKPLLLLLFAAALTAGWNPIYLWSDIGWHLSFLAFFGVLILAPLVKQRIYGAKEQKLLGQIVLESICAQVMAAPLILYIFGEVSLIALISNAIIVPLVPLAMLFALLAGLAGALLPVISGFIAVPATLLLTYMLDLVALFASVPHALVSTQITLANMLYAYMLILFYTILLQRVLKRKYARITDRNIIE